MQDRRLAFALLAGVALAYFGSLIWAARGYPNLYDWRHAVISNLANPRDNPVHWRVAADGLALTGLLLALLGPEVRRALHPYAPRAMVWTGGFLILGGALLTVSALITPGHHALFGLGKAHAKFAQASGLAFGLALACTLPALRRLPPRLRWQRACALTLVIVPISLFLLCHFLFPVLEAHAPPEQRPAIHHSLGASLAFWEWIGSATVYAFLTLVTLGLGQPSPASKSRREK